MDEQTKAINTRIFSEIKKESYEVLYALDTSTENAAAMNRDLLLRVMEKNSGTEYGKKYGFSEIHDADTYRRNVPLTEYSDYAPYIERMTQRGEQNLLTAAPPVYYASTSGSTGKPKDIPMTKDDLQSFLDYTTAPMTAVISEFYQNTRHTDIEYGKECAILSVARHVLPCGVECGSLSAAFMDDDDGEDEETDYFACYETTPREVMMCPGNADMKYLHARYALAEPDLVYFSGAYIAALLDIMVYIRDHYEMLVRDIRDGRIDPGIQMPGELRETLEAALVPDPERAGFLQKEFRQGFDTTITALQMKGYVLITDFDYEVDKNGEFYGWGIARYATPEEFYGKNFAEHCYKRTPEESYERLFKQIKKLTKADDFLIERFLG